MRIKIYQNKRNEHKYLEVHEYKCRHQSVRQYMYWSSTGVKNYMGRGTLIRWRKQNLQELLVDYRLVYNLIK